MRSRCGAAGLLLAALTAAVIPGSSLSGTVIPPAWVDLKLNPCSTQSWQLVRWPGDGQCYPIYQRGPCAETQELVWDRDRGQPECVCPDGHLPHGGRCYRRHSRGPCPLRHYLQEDERTGEVSCVGLGRCPPGEVFWPAEQRCHRYLSRGPCGKGELVTLNRATLEPECGCSRRQMARSYWIHTDSCYQELTRGPCPHGLVFTFNSTRGLAECGCHPGLLENYDRRTRQCYTSGQRGPCPPGNTFAYNPATGSTECRCLEDSLVMPDTGACHRAFAQGPCKQGRFVAPRSTAPHQGVCVANPCRRGELYFPQDQYCHRIGRQGPCPDGQLVQYEQFRGISYRGACGCTEHFTQNYWPADGRCYELRSLGPCPDTFSFTYNATSARTECACDEQLGHALHPDSGQCGQAGARGACPAGQVLLPAGQDRTGRETLRCGCPAGTALDTRRSECNVVAPRRRQAFKSFDLLRLMR